MPNELCPQTSHEQRNKNPTEASALLLFCSNAAKVRRNRQRHPSHSVMDEYWSLWQQERIAALRSWWCFYALDSRRSSVPTRRHFVSTFGFLCSWRAAVDALPHSAPRGDPCSCPPTWTILAEPLPSPRHTPCATTRTIKSKTVIIKSLSCDQIRERSLVVKPM